MATEYSKNIVPHQMKMIPTYLKQNVVIPSIGANGPEPGYDYGNGTTQNSQLALCCYNKAALEEKPREGKQTISVQTIR
jgi:hypothetical protein